MLIDVWRKCCYQCLCWYFEFSSKFLFYLLLHWQYSLCNFKPFRQSVRSHCCSLNMKQTFLTHLWCLLKEVVGLPCRIYLSVASIVVLIRHYVFNRISLYILGNLKSRAFLHCKYLRSWKNKIRVQMRVVFHSGCCCLPRYIPLFLINTVMVDLYIPSQ